MKEIIKLVIALTAGLAGGGTGGYFIGKKIQEKKDVEQLAAIRQYYDKLAPARESVKKRVKVEKKETVNTLSEDPPTEYKTSIGEESLIRKGKNIDYTKYFGSGEHPEDDYEGHQITEEHKNNKHKEPKIIKAADFGSDPAYDMQGLLYYVEDDTVVLEDDDTNVVLSKNEVESMIGDALTKYGFADNPDEDVIYVRNFSRNVDYEINKIFEPYQDS